MTVTAEDQYGNATPNYRGTVHFDGSGPPAAWVVNAPLFPGFDRFDGFDLPGDYAFTAADAGRGSFTGGVKIIFAGDQKVTAADTQDETITGSQTVNITPGSGDRLQRLGAAGAWRRPRAPPTSSVRRSPSSA